MGFILFMEKGAIFIDGAYLNKILGNCFNNIKIDYLDFSDNICNNLGITRLRTYYYHSLPIIRGGIPSDVLKKAEMQKFFTSINRLPRFEVKLGKLQIINDQFKQKMIDVLMSLDIATMSYEKQILHAILIAGDSDFIPAIRKAKNYGTIIHLYYHPSSVHSDVIDEVDETHEINLKLLDKCIKK